MSQDARLLKGKHRQNSELGYRELADSLPQTIFEMDRNGTLTYANRGAFDIFGYTQEDYDKGLNALQMLIPEDRENAKEAIQKCFRGETVGAIEYTALRKDGTTFPVVVHSISVMLGEQVAAIRGILVDISGQKSTEHALRESEQKYRLLSENIPVAVYSSLPDKYSTNIFTSGRIEEITGYSIEECIKAPTLWSRIIHEDDREHVLNEVFENIRNKTPFDMEYRIISKDGSVKWIRDKASPMLNESGEVIRVNGFMEDITQRKRLEQELKKHTEHLEILVERNEDTKKINAIIMDRLIQKIGQIDNVAKIRESLRTTPDISTGLKLVLDTALKSFGMDAVAIYTIDLKMNAARLRNFKSKIEGIRVDESYPLDAKFACMDALKQNRAISKAIGPQERSILKTASIHCAPIHLGKELHGFLALGSKDARVLDNSDLAILSLYADLASTIFETQNLTVTPVKEGEKGAKRRFNLELGSAYLVKNNVEMAFEIFADNVLSGSQGLCITREFPSKVRKKYGLERTPIIWLTEERMEGQSTVHALQDLSIIVGSFLEKTQSGIVLLDGAEYLITSHGFEPFIRFLQLNRSRIESKDAILIMPLSEEALELTQEKLITREMSTFESKQYQET